MTKTRVISKLIKTWVMSKTRVMSKQWKNWKNYDKTSDKHKVKKCDVSIMVLNKEKQNTKQLWQTQCQKSNQTLTNTLSNYKDKHNVKNSDKTLTVWKILTIIVAYNLFKILFKKKIVNVSKN